jgi:hypothetical protein
VATCCAGLPALAYFCGGDDAHHGVEKPGRQDRVEPSCCRQRRWAHPSSWSIAEDVPDVPADLHQLLPETPAESIMPRGSGAGGNLTPLWESIGLAGRDHGDRGGPRLVAAALPTSRDWRIFA